MLGETVAGLTMRQSSMAQHISRRLFVQRGASVQVFDVR